VRTVLILSALLGEAMAQEPAITMPEETAPGPGSGRRIPIGSYGEAFYLQNSEGTEEAQLRRLVLFLGHQFDERFRVYSEIEIEHGNEVEMEQAFVEYRHCPCLGARAGLVLVPVGILNVLHESPTFHGNERPQLDQVLVPTTWRELGAGLFGELPYGIKYEAYLLRGLDASPDPDEGRLGFTDDRPIRGGRLGGNEGSAESAAGVFHLGWSPLGIVDLGASLYYGDASQGEPAIDSVRVTMVEGDARFRRSGFEARAQFAHLAITNVDDIARARADPENPGPRVSSHNGLYVEAGYDVLHMMRSRHEVIPFFRFERLDVGFPDPTIVLQGGVTYRPHPQVAVKGDVARIDSGAVAETRLALGLGYMF